MRRFGVTSWTLIFGSDFLRFPGTGVGVDAISVLGSDRRDPQYQREWMLSPFLFRRLGSTVLRLSSYMLLGLEGPPQRNVGGKHGPEVPSQSLYLFSTCLWWSTPVLSTLSRHETLRPYGVLTVHQGTPTLDFFCLVRTVWCSDLPVQPFSKTSHSSWTELYTLRLVDPRLLPCPVSRCGSLIRSPLSTADLCSTGHSYNGEVRIVLYFTSTVLFLFFLSGPYRRVWTLGS